MELVRNLKNITELQQIYIYGAGIVAASAYTALRELCGIIPNKFVVFSAMGNPDQIDGIPVITVDEACSSMHNAAFWIIAVPIIHHGDIKKILLQRGISRENMLYIDNQLENMLMETYFCKKGYVAASEFRDKVTSNCSGKNVEVYQAKCHLDKPLSDAPALPKYVKPIQVGAALTKQQIAPITDNMCEDNISSQNGNYCELTATYYAWKHSNAEYKGICHYRRIFDLSDEMLHKMIESNVDVILPYPTIHYPNIGVQHSRYIKDSDWNIMRQAVEEAAPEYGMDFDSIFSGQYFYNFNMLIAKREVFDDYSSVLFSILKRAEESAKPNGWERSDRVAGYMGENLTTLYFRKNADRLKIALAGKLLFG